MFFSSCGVHIVHGENGVGKNSTGETVEAKSDKTIYRYGDTIHLTISDTNYGPQKVISTFKSTYAGIGGPCGIQYLDFVFLNGDYTGIRNYDEITSEKNNTLNVVYSSPHELVSCPYVLRDIRNVTMDSNSNHVTIFSGSGNRTDKMEEDLITVYNIDNMYDKKTSYKQISKDKTEMYVSSQLIPQGKYTIIAFTLSGEIGKPLLIQIGNASPLKQFESGISLHDIKCNTGLYLLVKTSDNSPVCVKLQTAQKLVERGWGKSMVQTTWFELNPIKCHAPWDEYWFKKSPTANTTIATTPSMIINYYFKNNGITLFETRESPTLHTVPPPCGQPAEETYYFLVSESDVVIM